MTGALARTAMALAVRSLGGRQSEWARAMEAEFELAQADGKPLAFALGCLLTAWRTLPAHEEGRFAIASHVLALGIIVPVAALMVFSLLTGFPSSYLGHVGVHGLLAAGGEQGPLLSEGNFFAIPSLAILVILFAGLNLRIAWLALDRDWERLAHVGALGAAATATLAIVSTVAFADYVAALAQASILAAELTAASALARWHACLPAVPSEPSRG